MTEENPAAEWRAVELDSEAFKREFEGGDPVRISYEKPDGTREMTEDLVVCLPAKEHAVNPEWGHKLVALEEEPTNFPEEYHRVKVFTECGTVRASDGMDTESSPWLVGGKATVWTQVGGDEEEQ